MGYSFSKKTKIVNMAILGLILSLIGWFIYFKNPVHNFDFSGARKRVAVEINGLSLGIVKTEANTVGDFLSEQKIIISGEDKVWPLAESLIYSGSILSVDLARKVSFLDGNEKTEGYVLGLTVEEALMENNISIGGDDLISPELGALAGEGEKIKITRVEIKEEKEIKKIDFKKVVKEDDKLGWREKKISQVGKLGKKELTYKAVYHNTKLISRKLLGEEVIKEPTEEISTQGTLMKLGKGKTGQASHYAASWGSLNASRDIPRGGFAKVTNLENGKSVVVKINDFGPISPQRVIDLSFDAFLKLANDWQGIIPRVKVEQVLN